MSSEKQEISVEQAVAELQDAEAESTRQNAIVIREASKVAAKIAPLLSENDINITPASCLALGMLFASGARHFGVERDVFTQIALEFFDKIAAPGVVEDKAPEPEALPAPEDAPQS